MNFDLFGMDFFSIFFVASTTLLSWKLSLIVSAGHLYWFPMYMHFGSRVKQNTLGITLSESHSGEDCVCAEAFDCALCLHTVSVR